MTELTFTAKTHTNSKTSWNGRIKAIRIDREPYELEVNARGSCFHLIVGKHAYGNYICIPNWNVGTELASLDDVFWNKERLHQEGRLKLVDASSVSYALLELSRYVT